MNTNNSIVQLIGTRLTTIEVIQVLQFIIEFSLSTFITSKNKKEELDIILEIKEKLYQLSKKLLYLTSSTQFANEIRLTINELYFDYDFIFDKYTQLLFHNKILHQTYDAIIEYDIVKYILSDYITPLDTIIKYGCQFTLLLENENEYYFGLQIRSIDYHAHPHYDFLINDYQNEIELEDMIKLLNYTKELFQLLPTIKNKVIKCIHHS
jgi:hypothetical protein